MNKILVVDDNKDILVVTKLILELHNYTVKTIFNGEETIEAIKDFVPNIVLLDIFLGATSGIIICEEIKRVYPTVCVIMFSAHARRDDVLKLCPANGFIEKPFEIPDLLQLLKEEIGKCGD